MARPIRVEFENAVYHVTARGNKRKDIYRDPGDRPSRSPPRSASTNPHRWKTASPTREESDVFIYSLPRDPPQKNILKWPKRLETGTVIVYTVHTYPIHPPSYTSDLHSRPPSSSPKRQRRYGEYRTAMTPRPTMLPPFLFRTLHYLLPSTEGILHRPPVGGCHFTHRPMTVNTPGIPSY